MSDIWASSEEWTQLVRITDDLVDALNKSIEHLPFEADTPIDLSPRLDQSQSKASKLSNAERTHDRNEEEEDKCADRVTAMEQRVHSSRTPTLAQSQSQGPPTTSTPEEGVQISKRNGSDRKHDQYGHGTGNGTGTDICAGTGMPPPVMPKPKLDSKLLLAAAAR